MRHHNKKSCQDAREIDPRFTLRKRRHVHYFHSFDFGKLTFEHLRRQPDYIGSISKAGFVVDILYEGFSG